MTLRSRLVSALMITVLAAPGSSMATQHESVRIDSSVAPHMRLHITAVRAIRLFIIAGQLDGVPGSADWLMEHEIPPELPGEWAPYVADMRSYAEQAASARHLVFAAAAVSEMARTCGDCHAANGVSDVFDEDLRPPPAGESVSAQMQRHLWAADRMWEGLIGPSDAAWSRGTEKLAEIRLSSSDFAIAAEQEPALSYLLRRTREIGEEGSQADSRESRSTLYGEFLSMCGDCHTLVGGGPAPPRTVLPAADQ
ncbi:MAG: hypothetical protein OER85_10370 [Gammaproteobacteria bacterium]|nr:hypothetical protein [Gammaproteobacteria bacterium]